LLAGLYPEMMSMVSKCMETSSEWTMHCITFDTLYGCLNCVLPVQKMGGGVADFACEILRAVEINN